MWGFLSTTFLLVYFLMSCYIGRRGWVALGKPASRLYRIIYWVFFSLLVLSFPAAEIGEDFLSDTGGLWLTIWGGYSMVGVSYIFLLLLLIDILRLLNKGIGFVPAVIKEHKKTPLVLGAVVVIIVSVILVYGGWNARNPVVTEYDLTVHKLITGQLYELDWGLLKKGDYHLIVSSGYGTWGPPLRVGNNPEVVSITMKFNNEK